MLSAEYGPDGPRVDSSSFSISPRQIDERISVVTVEGDLDLATAPELKWALVDLFDAGRDRLVLDLSKVAFMDPTALGVLVAMGRSLRAPQRLAIGNPQPQVVKVFELTGADRAFHIFPTVDAALAYARSADDSGRLSSQ